MCYKGIFKRFVPFLLTFAAGLFIASFFVSIALPTLPRSERRNQRFQRQERMQRDLELLRQENERLRRELEFHSIGPAHLSIPDVPPVPLEEPAPLRVPRFR